MPRTTEQTKSAQPRALFLRLAGIDQQRKPGKGRESWKNRIAQYRAIIDRNDGK